MVRITAWWLSHVDCLLMCFVMIWVIQERILAVNTVLVDGQSVRSCLMFAVQANGHEVMTVEGLAHNGAMHPLQQAFWEKQGLQCGFCTPGFLMTAYELLQHNPNPSEEEIRDALSGNICRCTGYQHIIEAVQSAAQSMASSASVPSGTEAR